MMVTASRMLLLTQLALIFFLEITHGMQLLALEDLNGYSYVHRTSHLNTTSWSSVVWDLPQESRELTTVVLLRSGLGFMRKLAVGVRLI